MQGDAQARPWQGVGQSEQREIRYFISSTLSMMWPSHFDLFHTIAAQFVARKGLFTLRVWVRVNPKIAKAGNGRTAGGGQTLQ
jgi:diaminopimelate decarboxylase